MRQNMKISLPVGAAAAKENVQKPGLSGCPERQRLKSGQHYAQQPCEKRGYGMLTDSG